MIDNYNEEIFHFSSKFNFILLSLIYLSHIIKSNIIECPKDKPFLMLESGECKQNCSNDLNSNECIINNPIIKTQWLNNFIIFGEFSYRYICFATYPNGDMVVEATGVPYNPKRMFYGLKKNGRPLFRNKITNEETAYYSINRTTSTYKMSEAKAAIIKLSGNNNRGKEYFISVSKWNCDTELIDFENDMIYGRTVNQFTSTTEIYSIVHTFMPIYNSSDSTYYYLFGFHSGSSNRRVFFQKHVFNSISDFEESTSCINSGFNVVNAFGYGITCFKTVKEKICCFFMTKSNSNTYINYLKYNKDFSDRINKSFPSTIKEDGSFIKCIHLKDEVGVFAYYYNETNIVYPVISFKIFDSSTNNFENYLDSFQYPSSEIKLLKNLSYYHSVLFNDIITITEKKIVFVATNTRKDDLYIIVIHIYGEKKLKVRYYSLQLYNFYHYKVLFEIYLNNYNNFTALALSFCPIENCNSDDDEHYSGLMIFSYPNITDNTMEIDKYLFDNSNLTINDLEINLQNKINIDNNIFGYIISNFVVKDIIGCGQYQLYLENNEVLQANSVFNLEDRIKVVYAEDSNIYQTVNCTIQYYLSITEPDLDTYNSYTTYNEYADEGDLFVKNHYYGKLAYYNILLNKELTTNCGNNCDLCLKENTSYCITCKNEFLLSEDKTTKICQKVDTTDLYEEEEKNMNEEEKYEEEEYEEGKTDINEEEKTDKNENILFYEKICLNEYQDYLLTDDEMKGLNEFIKEKYFKEQYKGNNTIILTQNAIYQISNLEDQKNGDNKGISNVNLNKCEKKLRDENHIEEQEPLLIYKIDIRNQDSIQTYVQYEVYETKNYTLLNLSVCKDFTIIVETPVYLNDSISSLYDSLKESGYNLFNINDDFYNDICSTYTSENKTDISLTDRKNIIYENNGKIALCQNGCELDYYNSTNKKAKCNCNPQTKTTVIDLSSIYEQIKTTEVVDIFKESLKNSNFLVLKCYKLALDLKTLWTNYGRIFMSIIFILSLIFLCIFCFYDQRKTTQYISKVYQIKMYLKNKNTSKEIIGQQNQKKNNNIKNKEKKDTQKNNCRKIKTNDDKKLNKKSNNINKEHLKTVIKSKKKLFPPKRNALVNNANRKSLLDKKNLESNATVNRLLNKKKQNSNSINNQIFSLKTTNIKELNIRQIKGKNKPKVLNIKEKNINFTSNNLNIKKNNKIGKTVFKNNKINDKFNKKFDDNHKLKTFNDYELNNLEYERALKFDKRNYFQYYWSLLKKKQLILFTFYPADDYNLVTAKICLFLLSFSLYFTINSFFFNDETMHKIYMDNGVFVIINQIPVILYSSLISSVTNMILKQLSLSEKSILELKNENDDKRMKERSKNIRKCLTRKFILFFILNFLLLSFFWYFITCFCAVYINTQKILIKDTLISFGISMLYPFGLNLIPGFFRIPSLKNKKKDKKCIYKLSLLIAYL